MKRKTSDYSLWIITSLLFVAALGYATWQTVFIYSMTEEQYNAYREKKRIEHYLHSSNRPGSRKSSDTIIFVDSLHKKFGKNGAIAGHWIFVLIAFAVWKMANYMTENSNEGKSKEKDNENKKN